MGILMRRFKREKHKMEMNLYQESLVNISIYTFRKDLLGSFEYLRVEFKRDVKDLQRIQYKRNIKIKRF